MIGKTSIIIVNYRVKRLLLECIESIIASRPKSDYEIIIVDNEKDRSLKKILKQKYSKVKYIESPNLGFGHANNIGSQIADGEFLFFLNPDTRVYKGTIDNLVSFLKNNKKVGIVAPLLLDKKENPYELQGTKLLNLWNCLFAYTFLNKWLPDNSVSKKFWMRGWNKSKIKEVDVVPGTALMIKHDIFEEVGGFDDKLFLYFEEYDVCKRVKDVGYKNFINPESRVLHYWGESTRKSRLDIRSIYNSSRYYYFKKHFGILKAIFVTGALSVNKLNLFIFAVLLFAFLLRLFRLEQLMIMISDQGWFYLSARDILVNGNIPLVGITASHTWLHQGPIWTYMLAFVLWLSRGDPLSGGYLSVLLDTVTILFVYNLARKIFSTTVGVLASVLYAFSPLIVEYARMPYHTSPIPLLSTLFLLALISWIQGKKIYLPISAFIFGLLYNFELATVLFALILGAVFFYGWIKKETWSRLSPGLIVATVSAFSIPMIPILIYDFQNGFNQTIKFGAWIVAEVISLFGINLIPDYPTESVSQVFQYFLNNFARLVSPISLEFAIYLFAIIVVLNGVYIANKFLGKKLNNKTVIYYMCTVVLILGFFSQKSSSGAYLPMLFPFLIIAVVAWVDLLHRFKPVLMVFFGSVAISNVYFLLANNYYATAPIEPQRNAAHFIVREANQKQFVLGKRNFKSNIDIFQYQYLVLWQGGDIRSQADLRFYIYNNSEGAPQDPIYKDHDISITKIDGT